MIFHISTYIATGFTHRGAPLVKLDSLNIRHRLWNYQDRTINRIEHPVRYAAEEETCYF